VCQGGWSTILGADSVHSAGLSPTLALHAHTLPHELHAVASTASRRRNNTLALSPGHATHYGERLDDLASLESFYGGLQPSEGAWSTPQKDRWPGSCVLAAMPAGSKLPASSPAQTLSPSPAASAWTSGSRSLTTRMEIISGSPGLPMSTQATPRGVVAAGSLPQDADRMSTLCDTASKLAPDSPASTFLPLPPAAASGFGPSSVRRTLF
jgi:hypothetical protein